jgi:hypothetical protein
LNGDDDTSSPLRRAFPALACAIAIHGALLAGVVCLVTGDGSRCVRSLVARPILDAVIFDLVVLKEPSRAKRPAPPHARVQSDARADSVVSSSTVEASATRPGRELAAATSADREVAGATTADREVAGARDTTAPAPFTGVTMGAPVRTSAIGTALGAPNRFVGKDAPSDRGEGDEARGAPGAPGARGNGPWLQPPTAADAKRTADNWLREPARRREHEVGLGPEGPVLKALGKATSASSAPVTGRAVFSAVADSAGLIVGIDVIECDGARSGWANAAELARAGLAGTKLRMPDRAQRAEMRVEITSTWKIPSGHDPGTDVSVFGVDTSKGDGKNSPQVAVLDVLPKVRVVQLSRDLKVPVVIVDPDVIRIKGDAANTNAKPRRVVHARLLSSTML